MRKLDVCLGEIKGKISFAVTVKLISAFVSTTWIVQSLFLLSPKFQAETVQACLCQTWSEIPRTSFLTPRIKWKPTHPYPIKLVLSTHFHQTKREKYFDTTTNLTDAHLKMGLKFHNSVILLQFDKKSSKVKQVIFFPASIGMPNIQALAQLLFEISCTQILQILFSKGHNSKRGHDLDVKKIRVNYFLKRNLSMKFQIPSIHCIKVLNFTEK